MRSWVGFDPRNQQKKTKSGQVLGRKETGQGGKRRTRGPNLIRVFLWRRLRCRGGRKDNAGEAHEANAAHHQEATTADTSWAPLEGASQEQASLSFSSMAGWGRRSDATWAPIVIFESNVTPRIVMVSAMGT
jgi:hypothetical protein